MKFTSAVALLSFAIALGGCYSSARHIANVRPDMIKPDTTLVSKYKLERIVLKKSSFSRKVAEAPTHAMFEQRRREALDLKNKIIRGDVDAYIEYLQKSYPGYFKPGSEILCKSRDAFLASSLKDRQAKAESIAKDVLAIIEYERKVCNDLLKEDKKSGPNGTHYADTQMIFDSVRGALFRDYPTVFTGAANAIPIAVVIDWATEYKPLPDYASIFSGWFWPVAAEQQSIYHMSSKTRAARRMMNCGIRIFPRRRNIHCHQNAASRHECQKCGSLNCFPRDLSLVQAKAISRIHSVLCVAARIRLWALHQGKWDHESALSTWYSNPRLMVMSSPLRL